MSLTYGFYNSINEDRKYNASQMSKLFDGVLNDGIFMSIGDKLMVSANTGMNVSVGTGRAWFDHTWTLNDSILLLPVTASELLLNRIDVVVLEVNNTEAVRANSIKIVKGAGATVPVAPTLVNTSEIHQYPLAHIYVGVGVTEIIAANITNKVGTSETPFATGVMQTMSIDALIAQWQGEWDNWSSVQQADYMAWFNNINSLLGTEPATNLQIQITALDNDKADKSTEVAYTLLASAWAGASAPFTCEFPVAGVTATSNQEILPALTITVDQLKSFQKGNVVDNGQLEGNIKLKAFGIKPTYDVPLRIILRGDK